MAHYSKPPLPAGTSNSPTKQDNVNMKHLDKLAAVLLVIGGLNWGLVGLFQFDLVASIFGGADASVARLIYALVGLAAVYQMFQVKGIQRRWSSPAS